MTLHGARIGLLEARLSSELAALVRREGGDPVCAPAVVEAPLDVTSSIPALVEDVRLGRVAMTVALTGAGVKEMLRQAETIGHLGPLADALRATTTVCRGPKPAAVLREHAIPVHASAGAPYTTAELLAELPERLVHGRGLLLIHDGGGNAALADALRLRGARVTELHTYAWRLPDDVAPLESLIARAIDGSIDALACTSQVQVRHLFAIAERSGRADALRGALRDRTLVASIGPTCTAALEQHGVPPHVTATPPKMRPLVTAIGRALAARHGHSSAESQP
jgi:uroporphyrinogen-III synthase